MKKIIGLMLIILAHQITESCNLCWGYPKTPRLKTTAIAPTKCSCECWQYPHTRSNNDAYICTNCSHRMTPPDPTRKDTQRQYQRWTTKKH